MGSLRATESGDLLGEDSILPSLERLIPGAIPFSMPQVKPGDVVGPYRLLRQLGSGGMGVVFEAVREDGEISMRVAVKVLHPELCTPEFLRQMRQEASKLAKLRHPDIARLLDWKLDGDLRPYCVLEYIDGEPITAWCRHRGLSRADRLRLFEAVCVPVAFAHSCWIVHLDLKPQNILVKDSGEIRLLDFGIARSLLQDEGATNETALRAFSARYASPEQVYAGPVSVQSDVYSLGIILRELLALPSPRSRRERNSPSLPYELDAIVARAAAERPQARYSSVAELQQDLRNYLEKRPVSAVPQTAAYRLRKFCRRNARLLLVSVLLFSGLLAGLGSWQTRRRLQEEQVHSERLRKAIHQLSSTVLFPLEDEMRNLPGATPARMIAVRTGLESLQMLSAEAGKDPETIAQLAEAYTKLGDIQGDPANANLGDESGARDSYAKARKLVDKARDAEGRYAYATALVHEGDLVDTEGDKQAAESMYEEAVGVLRGLTGTGSKNIKAAEGLKSALIDLGDMQSEKGNDELARSDYNQAVDVSRQILGWDPSNPTYERSLARCLSRLGNVAWNKGNWQQAFTAYRGSLDVYDRLLRQMPNNIKVRHSWIAGAYNVADTDEQLGHLNEALDLYTRAEGLASEDARIDPQDTMSLRDAQVGYSDLTRVLLHLGRLAEAGQDCRRELAIAGQLWKLNPGNAMARDDLAGSEEHLAEVFAAQHLYVPAIANEKKALRLLSANVEANRSAESMGSEIDALLRVANYSLDLGVRHPEQRGPTVRDARDCLAQLHRLDSSLRLGHAEDRDRLAKIHALEARLR